MRLSVLLPVLLPLLACGAPSPAEVCKRLDAAGCLSSEDNDSCREQNEYLLDVTDRLGCEGAFSEYLRCRQDAAEEATCDPCLHTFVDVARCIGDAESGDGELPPPPESDEPSVACQNVPTASSFEREIASNNACAADADCTTVPVRGSCFAFCPAAVNRSQVEKMRGYVELKDDVYCGRALEEACVLPPAAECEEAAPRCVDGACE